MPSRLAEELAELFRTRPELARLRELVAQFRTRPELMEDLAREVHQLELQREEAREAARLQGRIEVIEYMLARRLRRPLTTVERDLLTTRAREQGANPVSDLVFDSSPAELEAWLGTAAAR